jgi:hypothetical protein
MLLKRAFLIAVVLLTFFQPYAQVNLQSGSAVFSIPMFNWQDDKSRLKALVALSYNSGNGLKVNDVASSEGQGWNLAAGGVITRLQIGEPDDQQAFAGSGTGTSLDISRYPAGYMYATQALANGCPEALAKYPIYKGMNQIYTNHNVTLEDKTLDYFAFQFNGKVGEFALDVVHGIGVSLGDSRMKISFQTDQTLTGKQIRTTITSFTIQDIDGLTYIFSVHGMTKVLHSDFCDRSLAVPQKQPTFKGGHVYYQSAFDNQGLTNPWIIASWYLSEIDDSLTNRKVTFTYNMRNINTSAGEDLSYNQNGNYSIVSHKVSISQTPSLYLIQMPDSHYVRFNTGAARIDMTGDSALASVDVGYSNRMISEYQLNTTYFISNRLGNPKTTQQIQAARLCLRSVTKIGVDLKEDSPPYIFDYYLNSGSGNADDFVPSPFCYTKDIWGFYNGNNSVPYDNTANNAIPLNSSVLLLNNDQLEGLCFLNQSVPGQVYLNPKNKYAENGLLRQIIYPTGGTLTYKYAQDSGSYNGTTVVPVGGVKVVQTSTTDGGNSNGCGNPIVTSYNYVTTSGTPSLWGLENPVNSTVMTSHYNSEDKKYHWTWSCAPFGCCYWNYQYPGILSQLEAVNLSSLQTLMNTLAPYLGVLTVVSDILDVLNLVFVSTGVLAWVAVIVDIIGGLVTLGITCFSGNNSKDNTFTAFYNTDLNGANPLPTQFSRVEIIEGTGGIGKTVQEFTSSADYALWVGPGQNTDFSSKQRYANWAYGLPKTKTVYDVNGNVVKQVVNAYSWNDQDCQLPPPPAPDSLPSSGGTYSAALVKSAAVSPASVGPSCALKIKKNLGLRCVKCLVLHSSSQNNTDWDDPTKYNLTYLTSTTSDINVDTFDLYTGRLELTSTTVTDYSTVTPANNVQTVTSFSYNGYYNYEVNETTTTESNGDVSHTYMSYSSDYPSTQNAAIQKLVKRNIIAEPVRTMTTVINNNPGGPYNEYALGEKVTQFVQIANGDIRPAAILEQRFTKPTPGVAIYSPDNPNNGSIYKVINSFTYDANSNLIGQTDEGGRTLTNLYDYNDKYIVATVINADPVLDKVAYTSFETAGLGGWTLTGTPAYSGAAMTGARSLALGSLTLSAPLNSNKEYTLSLWATSPVSVTPGALLKSQPTKNGFTYYEYDIPAGNAVVNIGGNVNIDEVRLYPKMALMRTGTFDRIMGKTSECDENNRMRYYTYDNLGRMKTIQDEDHNILKMYEYNNVSAAKQNGCPGTYSNNLITENFTRSNCSAGYQGSDVPYTVPAARYTSAVSQILADAQAEMDLLVNGPANANANGSCMLIYHNVQQSVTDSIESCPVGMQGGFYTYTVPAGRYSSLVSQADADQQALDEISANAQAIANSPAEQSLCVINNNPDWVTQDGAATYCVNVNGALPPHQFQLATDENPNSPSYNQTQYMDMGPTSACPAGNYYNTVQSGTFYKNNCTSGTGLPITYTVAAGTYSSTTSLAAANQLATNDVNANGQAYANAHGSCCNQTFTYSTIITGSVENNFYLSGTQVYFTWVFTYPSGGLTSFGLGTINGSCCYPTGTRTIPFVQGSTTYNIVISTTGAVQLVIVSGPVPTGTVGFNGSYNLNQNAFYSAQESGVFTRNNCAAGQTGSTVTYTVPAYQYSSYISQADANQQAINQVNAGGQTYANANGTCTTSCGFSWTSGLNAYQSSVSSSGGTGTFNLVFSPSSSFSSGTIGSITGSCAPSGTRFLTVQDGATSGRSWNMTINTSGSISISLASGSAATNSGPPVVLSGTYSL